MASTPCDQLAGAQRLRYLDLESLITTTVSTGLGPVGLGLTASPDGRTILYTRLDSSVDDLMLAERFR